MSDASGMARGTRTSWRRGSTRGKQACARLQSTPPQRADIVRERARLLPLSARHREVRARGSFSPALRAVESRRHRAEVPRRSAAAHTRLRHAERAHTRQAGGARWAAADGAHPRIECRIVALMLTASSPPGRRRRRAELCCGAWSLVRVSPWSGPRYATRWWKSWRAVVAGKRLTPHLPARERTVLFVLVRCWAKLPAPRADAQRYLCAYHDAIGRIAAEVDPATRIEERPGLSIKLSALHPRYEIAQGQRVRAELLPRLADLCKAAAQAGIPLTIDAEEVDRLLLSLDLFERLARDDALAGGTAGAAVQAYQKRALAVCDWLAAWRRKRAGASWCVWSRRLLGHRDQLAQTLGLADYPVYTRKAATDVSYMAAHARCSKRKPPARTPLSAIRHTQRPHGGLHPERREHTSRFRIPEAAWHGRCAVRCARIRVRRRMPGLAPSAAIASPPYLVRPCSKTAPTHRSCIRWPTLSCRSKASPPTR